MPGRRVPRPRVPYQWRCWTCQVISTSWAAAQRHADAHGGGRIECLFELK
jgi:hypothetical protein